MLAVGDSVRITPSREYRVKFSEEMCQDPKTVAVIAISAWP